MCHAASPLFCEFHRLWLSKHSSPSLLLSHWYWKRPRGRGYCRHRLLCPAPTTVISPACLLSLWPCCTSVLIENTCTNSKCCESTLFFAPAWRLLSREYVMPVPCMAGAMPRRWQCSPLSPEEETVETSQLSSSSPHAGPVHRKPLIPDEEPSGFEQKYHSWLQGEDVKTKATKKLLIPKETSKTENSQSSEHMNVKSIML